MTSFVYMLLGTIIILCVSSMLFIIFISRKIDDLTKKFIKLINTFEGVNQNNIELIDINRELINKFNKNISFIKQYMIRRKIPNND